MSATASLLVSSESENWGTATEYVELARYALECFDLDPASDSYWNHYSVKAGTFYDERINGLISPWFGNVFHNPPSNREKKMYVKPWWERLSDHWLRGEVDAAVWIGFQMGQLQTLQGCTVHPLQSITLFPRERGDFLQRMPNNAPPQSAGSPMHANFITILPSRSNPALARAQLSRFVERSKALLGGGATVRPV